MNRVFVFFSLFFLIFLSLVSAQNDVYVFQGQYYENGKLQNGEFDFEFKVYDDKKNGNLFYSNSVFLKTGNFGEWYVELENITENITNFKKAYYMEVLVDGKLQGERRRMTQLNYMRKEVEQVVEGETVFVAPINVTNTSNFNEILVDNKQVCLENGEGCPIFNETDPKFSLEKTDIDKKFSTVFDKIRIGEESVSGNFFGGFGGVDNSWIKVEGDDRVEVQFSNKEEIYFNGENYIESKNDLTDYFLDSHSMSFFLKTTQRGSWGSRVSPGLFGYDMSYRYDDFFWGWIHSVGNIGFSYGSYEVKSLKKINDGGWHHIVVVYNEEESNLKIYIDGVLDNEGDMVVSDFEGQIRDLGRIDDYYPRYQYFNGFLKDFNFYDKVISSDEIWDLSLSKNKKVGGDICFEDGTGCPNFKQDELDPLFIVENKSIWKKISSLFNFIEGDGLRESVLNYTPEVNLSEYYSRSEIDFLLLDKVSIPKTISISDGVESWLPMVSGRMTFNENKLESFVASKITGFNFSNYYSKSEVDSIVSAIPKPDFSNYYTKAQVDSLNKGSSNVEILSSGSDVFYAYLDDSFKIMRTWRNIYFDNVVRSDSSFSFVEGSADLEFLKSGWYDIGFECTADVSANSRYHVDWRASLNGVEIPGTRSASYHRLRNDGRDTASISFVHEFDEGDVLRFQGLSDDNTRVFTVPNGCRLKVKSLSSVEDDDVKINKTGFNIGVLEIENPIVGDMYFDSAEFKLKVYDGVEWKSLGFEGEVVEEKEFVMDVVEAEEKVVEEKGEEIKAISSGGTEENKKELDEVEVNESNGGESGEESSEEIKGDEGGEVMEEQEEECEEVCEEVCEIEEVCEESCEDVETCEEVCETDDEGNEDCSDECSSEEVCEEVCEDVETCEEVCREVCDAPEQLFDIRMELESTVVKESSSLEAVVTYESFGSVPTPVDLTFEVLNLDGEVVYVKKGDIVVTVEEVRRYNFEDLILEPGRYHFVFTTLYNVDVEDEFKQIFEVKGPGFFEKVRTWFSGLF